jgi:spore maturation protein SpmA
VIVIDERGGHMLEVMVELLILIAILLGLLRAAIAAGLVELVALTLPILLLLGLISPMQPEPTAQDQ